MATRDPRITGPTLKVLQHFLRAPVTDLSGAAISKATGVGAGTLYPMLARLEAADWIVGHWEAVDPSEVGRPRRRLYQLTPVGRTRARAELAPFQQVEGQGGEAWAQ